MKLERAKMPSVATFFQAPSWWLQPSHWWLQSPAMAVSIGYDRG